MNIPDIKRMLESNEWDYIIVTDRESEVSLREALNDYPIWSLPRNYDWENIWRLSFNKKLVNYKVFVDDKARWISLVSYNLTK